MAIYCAAAERGGLRKKKRKKKSWWVKLKAFLTNVVRPKCVISALSPRTVSACVLYCTDSQSVTTFKRSRPRIVVPNGQCDISCVYVTAPALPLTPLTATCVDALLLICKISHNSPTSYASSLLLVSLCLTYRFAVTSYFKHRKFCSQITQKNIPKKSRQKMPKNLWSCLCRKHSGKQCVKHLRLNTAIASYNNEIHCLKTYQHRNKSSAWPRNVAQVKFSILFGGVSL